MDKICFLDRDGIINVKPPEHQHCLSWNDFHFLPNVKSAIEYIHNKGYKILIVTNQREVPKEIYEDIHTKLKKEIPLIEKFYVCDHPKGKCNCHKPAPGLFYKAEFDYNIDKKHSLMIGDQDTDVIAGEAYGIKSYKTNDLYKLVKEIL